MGRWYCQKEEERERGEESWSQTVPCSSNVLVIISLWLCVSLEISYFRMAVANLPKPHRTQVCML